MTAFADKVHTRIEDLEKNGKLTSTSAGRFNSLIVDISSHLGLRPDQVYVVSCKRPNNLNIRLTQGVAQHRHNVLGIGVMTEPGANDATVKSALKAGKTFIGDGNAQYDAIGVVIKKGGQWVIGGVLEAKGAGMVAKLEQDFPTMVKESTDKGPGAVQTTLPGIGTSMIRDAPRAPAAAPIPLNLDSLIPEFLNDLQAAQLVFGDKLLLRFCASLLARRFLVLTGLSGSGKTKLAEAFAKWLTPKTQESDDAHYKIVPVGADWTSSEQVLGYPDALNAARYETKPTLELLLAAGGTDRTGVPHFLILDEMNMSHVERYFAEFLSAMETGMPIDLYTGTLRGTVPRRIRLPPNFYVVGTVNVDETTYLFSPKVLDRANVVEFRAEEDEVFNFLETFSPVDLSQIEGKGAKFFAAFQAAAASKPQLSAEDKEGLADAFRRIFRVMSSLGREFGFRTLYDVARFTYYYRRLVGDANWSLDEAVDAQIYQRLLPRLNGSRAQLQLLIWALGAICIAPSLDDANFETHILKPLQQGSTLPNPFDDAANAQVIDGGFTGAKYPLSCEKLYRMDRRLREGFVSFMEA